MGTSVGVHFFGGKLEKLQRTALAITAAGLGTASAAQGRTLYWDPDKTAPASGGTGTWLVDGNASFANWTETAPPGAGAYTVWSSGTDQTVPNYSTAVFGGSGSTVTVQGQASYPVRFGTIQFTTGGYTFVPTGTNGYLGTRVTTSVIDTGNGGYSNQINAPFFVDTGNGGGPINITGNGTLTLGGTPPAGYNPNGLFVVNNGATLVLAIGSTNGSVRAVGGNTTTPGLQINSGATVRLGGTGGDQIRNRSTINVNGELEMNGRTEYVGPSNFIGSTLDFTLGSNLGENDLLGITNAATETGTIPGLATVSGTNTINITPRAGVTSLTPGNYTLITASSGLGTLAWVLGDSTIIVGGNTYALSVANSTSTAEILTITAVPEPTTAVALGLGGLSLLARRRRNEFRGPHSTTF